ncbi:hypothetical protein [Acinetobacter nosocomialis]|uniref:hypothetical protein n=1 Tax=Acinetobacter nosocomialis TaxID=106654 RepID=UPI001ADB1794|nr:hypothetical protein [Acinetobacter nosocomialis]MBO8208656.1 hypothetical protein [Acinetobacter nosocomialis]MBO8225107.1 hypothetical protein [Acinetobacter nosocomialis]MBO8249584.1 hypothetical protein [Acinetobacter nosocomialis]
MKKISTLAVSISFIMLTGCGGGSSSSNNTENVSSQAQEQSTQNVSSQAQGQSSQNVNSLKCDRGILLNSTLSANTIFDETLYSLNYRFKEISSGNPPTSIPQLYAYEIKRNDQMLYAYPKALYNITADEIESSLAEDIVQSYDLNSFGLFTKKTYQKQNNGWPLGYVVASQGSQITTAQFNDSCSLNSYNISYDYEKIDVSGKKISDIFPSNILTSRPENIDYLYMSDRLTLILKNNQTAFTNLLNSNETFPSGSFIYVPKSVIYNNTEFYFSDNNSTEFKTVAEWQQALYPKAKYKFDTVAGYNVTYSVDSAGNQIYSGGKDPAVEMNGKIYDAEWQVKGNVTSETYGEPATMWTTNYEPKGEFALYNKASYDFLVAQIQTYYK